MKKWLHIVFLLSLISCAAFGQPSGNLTALNHLETLQEKYIEDRFGMFICFNIMTYGVPWCEGNYPIDVFNPQELDCAQWAKSAKSAGMKFGLLTTKHGEGFCLWDSKYTDYDVASTPYKKDIVKQYTDAFREEDLGVGLYYCIWDHTHDLTRGHIGNNELDFVKGQLRELLTNYGKIDFLLLDGWFWAIGHKEIAYNEIRDLIRELQPDCLFSCHTHLQAMYHVDVPYLEGPHGAYPMEGSTSPTTIGHCTDLGNGWFWGDNIPGEMNRDDTPEVLQHLTTCEKRYCTFMLNCMPNRDGLLDVGTVELLEEVGKQWRPNHKRPPLPEQEPQIIYYVEAEDAYAFSGSAEHAIDAALHRTVPNRYKHWFSDARMPQWLTVDLGNVYDGLQVVTIVPNHTKKPMPETSLKDGNIKKYELYLSNDNEHFRKVAEGEWEADAQMKTIAFDSDHARYLKLNILDAENGRAIIAEIGVGAYSTVPWLMKANDGNK